MPANASGIAYAIGFMATTALLHCCGIGLGIGIQRMAKASLLRIAGATVAVTGLALFF
jgi:urease accessory protein